MVFITKSVLQKHVTFLMVYFTRILKYSKKDHQLSKSLQAINAGEGVEKREPSYTVGGNAN